ncbi:MAG: YbaK/EbsC family protein [Eubacterium sp.]|jgi:prolyl-tRNA editing enzyme YbaK/EbsC (Cys-tRNA(Pro) deacylase)|nr:YbaK/EbsC family protein [Eubacterium sp.]MCI2197261.1 YbaK/EbsC family protein [Eubacterium sp.]
MSVEKVKQYFKQFGMEDKILEFDVSSATVDLAAEAVGVEGARICKTLTFKDPENEDGCILVQMAGDARVNNGKFKRTFGFKPSMLAAEDALRITGHAVGGVCGFAIDNPLVKVYVDDSVKRFPTVFPAAGSGNSAIELTPDELYQYSKALDWVEVCKIPEA